MNEYEFIILNWIGFIILLLIVAFIAIFLPRYLIELFKTMKIDGVFLGVLLLSFITSMPEMLTVIFSSTINNVYVQGFSNIIGSNLITGLGFAFLDLFYFRLLTMNKMTVKLKKTTLFVFCLNLIFLLLLIKPEWTKLFYFNKVSLLAVLVLIIYGFFCWWLFNQKMTFPEDQLEISRSQIKFTISRWLLSSIVLSLICGLIMAMLGLFYFTDQLKGHYEWKDRTVGGLIFAIVTSSPEILSALSLFKLGFSTSAFGVIIGSHLFNLFFFIFFDLFFSDNILTKLAESDEKDHSLIYILVFVLIINLIWIFAQRYRFLHISKVYSIIPFMTIVFSIFSLMQFL